MLSKIYRARSNAVHSSEKSMGDFDSDKEVEVLKSSEDYLRLLLKYVIAHPDMEDSNSVDRVKRRRYS